MPLRLEIGPRDLAAGEATLVRRFTGEKLPIQLSEAVATVLGELDAGQEWLAAAAREHRDARIADVLNLDDAVTAAAEGWARIPWAAVGPEGEQQLAQSGVSVRCLTRTDGSLPDADDESELVAIVARAY